MGIKAVITVFINVKTFIIRVLHYYLYFQSLPYFCFILVGPFQAIIVVFILLNDVGKPVFAAIAVLAVLLVTQLLMGRLYSKYR